MIWEREDIGDNEFKNKLIQYTDKILNMPLPHIIYSTPTRKKFGELLNDLEQKCINKHIEDEKKSESYSYMLSKGIGISAHLQGHQLISSQYVPRYSIHWKKNKGDRYYAIYNKKINKHAIYYMERGKYHMRVVEPIDFNWFLSEFVIRNFKQANLGILLKRLKDI